MTEHLSKAGAFAAGIAHRYGDVPLMAPMLDMIVRLNPHPSVDRRSLHETCVQVAPQIVVTLNRPPRLVVDGPDRGRSDRSPTPPGIVRRLAQRQQRVEPGSPARPLDLQPPRTTALGPIESPPAPTTSAGQPGPPSASAVPMIVCRRATPTPGATSGNDTRAGGGSPQAFERQAGNRRQADQRRTADAPPAIDVERLTDKVVRAIDRRIVAYRERTVRS
jgi:hypothetical protein